MIECILTAHPKLGPALLSKSNLADAYMRIWVRLEDIPLVAFLVPKATPNEEQLVGFHLSIPIGYVESTAFFCATTKTVKERTLETLSGHILPHGSGPQIPPSQTWEEYATAHQESGTYGG